MKTLLVCHGKVKAPHAEADAHYRKLLSRHLPIEVVEVRAAADVAKRVPDAACAVALDVGGRAMTSEQWSRWLERRRLEARPLAFMIGGAEGLDRAAREIAGERLSLGPQTLAHQLARVVLLEQLYRAAKIAAGEPYHCA